MILSKNKYNIKVILKYILILYLSYFGHAHNTLCQNNFIRTYQNENSISTSFQGLLNINDTLVISGLSYHCVDANNCFQGFYISKLDTFGNILIDTVIFEIGDHFISENYPIILHVPKEGYYVVGEYLIKGSGVLVKLNNNFEVEFIQEFPENPSQILSVRNRGIIKVQNHYYILSIKQHTDFNSYIHLMKLDSLGNLKWDKVFNNEGSASVRFKNSKANNILIYGQLGKEFDDSTIGYKQIFIEVDTGGIILDSFQSNWMTNQYTGFNDLLEVDDSYIVSTNKFFYDPKFSSHPLYQSVLQKLDSDFEPIWETVYGDLTILSVIKNIYSLPDKTFIGVGNYTSTKNNVLEAAVSTLTLKFNKSGEISWDRLDSIMYDPTYGCRNAVGESIRLDNGSIYVSGFTEIIYPQPEVLSFLIKMDSMGCIDYGCNTVNTTGVELKKNIVSLWPNPVLNEITIKIISDNTPGSCIFTIVDNTGSICYRENIYLNNDEKTFNVSKLTTGIYHVNIQSNNYLYSVNFLKY